ncbi:hypothetical protein [Clostridium taeniosporum]|uniref:DUF4352 domain-containing protein n=1 Tax=Clostridium taeniosporum TaxID=394958 RepID=A0A1D7XK19_9CLOT|nr:hypothetical protein [Clostridium taeniosporum]AOR23675.1 hypothetical protein BGI42_07995 [Clostridium taeniosporum]
MKRLAILSLIALLMTGLVGCGGNNKNQSTESSKTKIEDTAKEKSNKQEKKEKIKTVQIGNTISNDSAEITINKIEFSYDVLPDDTSGFYTHYAAESGKVYINIDVDVKNIQKQDLPCDKIINVEANYNDGYQYKAQPIVEDASTGFTYANITSITPLETKGMRYLISCPQEVEETQNPLVITFNLNGEKYNYTIR